jgi:hypothetical protein
MQCHDCVHFDPGYDQTWDEPGQPEHCDVADEIDLVGQHERTQVVLQDLIRNLHLKLSELNNCPAYRQRPLKVYPVRIYPPNKYDDTKQHTFAYASNTRLEPAYSPEYHPD